MNTKIRLILLLSLLLLAFGASAWGLRLAHRAETRRMLENLQRERGELLGRLLDLTGQQLAGFARDYSNWDEMLHFTGTRDTAWAAINIDASLVNFGADAAWVLGADGQVLYTAARREEAALRALPFATPALLEKLKTGRFLHFYHHTEAGLLEIRTGPVQPSADVRRETEPRGWLLVGRLWDAAHLRLLEHVLESDVHLLPPGPYAQAAGDEAGVLLQHPLLGWDGRTAAVLRVHYHPTSLAMLAETNLDETFVLYAFGFAVVGATIFGLSRWVIRPLRQLEQGLATQSAAGLVRLREQPDEFGRLARLVEASFAQRTQLAQEVEERRHVEAALRRSTELRTRLARDLHDGLIQSIYAAGLGLEEVRRALDADPVAAGRRLDATQESLNRTIREVRNFINDLEPEALGQPGFAPALRALVDTLQRLHPVHLDLEISDEAAARLTPREELHALQIARESISNAMRHSGATAIRIRFHEENGRRKLLVSDNGSGFDSSITSATGNGLRNLAARAREINADLRLDTAPGRGTRLSLHFNPASPP